jgi:hypothetical protein
MSKQVIGILGDYSQREYASIEKAVSAGCIFILGDHIERKTWKGRNIRAIEVRQINSSDGKVIEYMQIGNWKLNDFFLTGWFVIDYEFEDPFGQLRRIGLSGKQDETAGERIEAMMNKLRELSSFMSWNEYDMSLQVEQLRQQIEELCGQVRTLENELKALRSGGEFV